MISPKEWAEELRENASDIENGVDYPCDRELTPADCRELADRMDDLAEALRLLRVWLGPEPWKQPLSDAKALLAKYEDTQSADCKYALDALDALEARELAKVKED